MCFDPTNEPKVRFSKKAGKPKEQKVRFQTNFQEIPSAVNENVYEKILFLRPLQHLFSDGFDPKKNKKEM